jgi:catechol 2,3-dioxygenase-like lactoylglutathione lyase family enzyme
MACRLAWGLLRSIGMAASTPFDETRAGLDHLAFTVADREELDAWVARLGMPGSSIPRSWQRTPYPVPAVVVFRDPDNIQLELFAEPPPLTRASRTLARRQCQSRLN